MIILSLRKLGLLTIFSMWKFFVITTKYMDTIVRGGGALITIFSFYPSKKNESQFNDIEFIAVMMNLRKSKTFFSYSFLSNSNSIIYSNHIDILFVLWEILTFLRFHRITHLMLQA